jgi:hypothetical protein
MRRAVIWLLAVLALSLPRVGMAQDPQPMEQPTLKAGDRWVYSWKDSRNQNGRSTWTVARIADFDGVPAYYIERTNEWTTAQGEKRTGKDTQIRDMQLNYLARLDDRGRVTRKQKVQWFRWPLAVGAQWESDGTYEFLDRGTWVQRRAKLFVHVRGAEEIPAPQGQVVAFRIYSIFRGFSADGSTALGHSESEDWLSPATRLFVKGWYKEGTYRSESALVEFQLTP